MKFGIILALVFALCGPPAALGGLCTVRIDRAPPIGGEVERAEITDLGVIESFRRRGIGRSLVEAASGWVRSRGVERVEVRVATRNPEGQAFWRAIGFSSTRIRSRDCSASPATRPEDKATPVPLPPDAL